MPGCIAITFVLRNAGGPTLLTAATNLDGGTLLGGIFVKVFSERRLERSVKSRLSLDGRILIINGHDNCICAQDRTRLLKLGNGLSNPTGTT
jgi:hypothetical protein